MEKLHKTLPSELSLLTVMVENDNKSSRHREHLYLHNICKCLNVYHGLVKETAKKLFLFSCPPLNDIAILVPGSKIIIK